MLTIYYSKQYKIEYSQYDFFKKEFIRNVRINLKDIESEIDEYENTIVFNRKSKYQTLMGKRDIFKVLRKGKISIFKNNDYILIKSKAELQDHLLISIFAGIMFSLALGVNAKFNVSFLINSFIIISNLSFFAGYFKVKFQLRRIIKFSISPILRNQIN